MKNRDVAKVMAAEYLKLKKRKTTLIIPAVVATLSALMFLAFRFAANRDWFGLPSGFFLSSYSLGWMVNLAGLLAVIMTCFHISGEFALSTVKPAWVRPVSRKGWFLGKYISVSGAVAAIFLLAALIVVLLAWVLCGFSPLLEKDYVVHTASDLGGKLALVIWLTLWALLALTAVTAMIATWFNRPGGAIALIVGMSLVLPVLAIFDPLKPFLLSSYLSQPLEQMTAMAKGISLPFAWGSLIRRTLVGAGVWMIISLFIGIRSIDKKEITF
ncbi:MAG: ABC transporter permease [Candidatus Krumholzibacteriota bacterium]|nr:ABC transporter permease [Candidatus Krumholzibacteriota bacterium]